MLHDKTQTIFVSQSTRTPLVQKAPNFLSSQDKLELFSIENSIVNLFRPNSTNFTQLQEMNIFDNIPVQGISYFRPSLYLQMLDKLSAYLNLNRRRRQPVFRFAELGGGEGHCARHVAKYIDRSEVYVCDLSRAALGRVPAQLHRVWADITKPIFAPGSLDAAAFWVSLHHINETEQTLALEEAYCALKDGGILILLEPNKAFFLRQMLYKSPLRHDVYFDSEECAIDFTLITSMAEKAGFTELETIFLNPRYNSEFVRQLNHWLLYLPVVEILHFGSIIGKKWQSKKHTSLLQYASLYGLSFFQKPIRATL